MRPGLFLVLCCSVVLCWAAKVEETCAGRFVPSNDVGEAVTRFMTSLKCITIFDNPIRQHSRSIPTNCLNLRLSGTPAFKDGFKLYFFVGGQNASTERNCLFVNRARFVIRTIGDLSFLDNTISLAVARDLGGRAAMIFQVDLEGPIYTYGWHCNPVEFFRDFFDSGGYPRTFHVASTFDLKDEYSDGDECEESDRESGKSGDLVNPRRRGLIFAAFLVCGVVLGGIGTWDMFKHGRFWILIVVSICGWVCWCIGWSIYMGWPWWGLFKWS